MFSFALNGLQLTNGLTALSQTNVTYGQDHNPEANEQAQGRNNNLRLQASDFCVACSIASIFQL